MHRLSIETFGTVHLARPSLGVRECGPERGDQAFVAPAPEALEPLGVHVAQITPAELVGVGVDLVASRGCDRLHTECVGNPLAHMAHQVQADLFDDDLTEQPCPGVLGREDLEFVERSAESHRRRPADSGISRALAPEAVMSMTATEGAVPSPEKSRAMGLPA